jgi:hypothetical protein
MTPYTIIAWCIIAAIVAAVLPYIIGKRALRKKSRLAASSEYDHLDVYESPALKAARERFREGGTITPRATAFSDAISAPYSGHGFRGATKQAVAARAAARKKAIYLTARELEHVNIKRRLSGKLPLNRDGFANAVAHAWDQPGRQPGTSAEWLAYLIVYECLLNEHGSYRTSVDTGLTITPAAPYNGHGGEFAGAGASGDWTSPGAQALAAAGVGMGVGAALDRDLPSNVEPATAGNGYHFTDPLSNPDSYKGSTDNSPGLNPDPVPSSTDNSPSPTPYSAPDTAPTYSAPDTSPSFDSSSSSNIPSPNFDPPSF